MKNESSSNLFVGLRLEQIKIISVEFSEAQFRSDLAAH